MSQSSSKIYCFNPSYDKESNIRDKTIFHYTSPEVIIEILSTNRIRFTDCQFLNDRTEYNHILEPLESAIDQVETTLYNKGLVDMIRRRINKNYQHEDYKLERNKDGQLLFSKSHSRYYIFCASTHPDSLNMWNYYIKNGSYQGYCIGLSVNKILEIAPGSIIDSVMFGEVIYDNKQKTSLLAELIEEADDELENAKKDLQISDVSFDDYQEMEEVIFSNLINNLDNFRLFFKDNAFEGEKEYRIAIRLPQAESNHLADNIKRGFTSKHGVITPCFDLLIPKNSLKSINLSPMLEYELATEGLQRLLKDKNFSSKIEIKKSAIPIRY